MYTPASQSPEPWTASVCTVTAVRPCLVAAEAAGKAGGAEVGQKTVTARAVRQGGGCKGSWATLGPLLETCLVLTLPLAVHGNLGINNFSDYKSNTLRNLKVTTP